MTDLTEQLYAGNLPTGHYYFNNGVETYIVLYSNINTKDRKMQEPSGLTVISEVPSYEEWEQLKEELKDYEYQHKQDGICYDDLFCKLELARKENRQLKTDCKALAQKLLQVKPERREWLEINYKEYL